LLNYARRLRELREEPMPAVLDTSCVRTGLHNHLATGSLPASLQAVADRTIRLFMELETLRETLRKLPEFASQLSVPPSELNRIFADDWLPLISVVSLPPELRALDDRAVAVRDLDADDYPTAALAALLSPCILLTHNHRHFQPLGVRMPSQGVDAVFAVMDLKIGETQVQAIAMVPVAPVVATAATVQWAWEKIGPVTLLILAVLVVGGIELYRRQPAERKQRIRSVAADAGHFLLEESAKACTKVQQAESLLGACAVPAPEPRSVTSAVFRELAMAHDSMSAQRLYDELDGSVRASVPRLRSFLHANKPSVFLEVRRGSFALGAPYVIRRAATSPVDTSSG